MIIGIDPGPKVQSFVLFDGERVLNSGDCSIAEMVAYLQLRQDILVACEWIDSYGMPVGSEVFQTVFNVGRIYSAAAAMRLVPRRDVKLHLCGTARAKDPNVRRALIEKLGPVGTKKQPGPCYGVSNHLWAALAVAVTAFEQERTKNEAFACE
jgi:hypothetical protein